MTPRGKELLIEYAVRDLRGLEQNGQLRTMMICLFNQLPHPRDGATYSTRRE